MNGSGINSSVLDRVKNFLPQIAKANEELEEQIKKEGQDVVRIDKDLVDRNEKKTKGSDDEEQSDEGDEDDEETAQKSGVPIVNIDFALGDFDGTAIAEAEQDSDDENKDCSESVRNP